MPNSFFKILFIGDLVGQPGRQTVAALLPQIKNEYAPDLVLANGENAAAGFGLTKGVYDELTRTLAIDLLTSGNHIWDKKELKGQLDDLPKVLRPANYPGQPTGQGYTILKVNDFKICVVSLLGRVFVNYNLDCPFQALTKIIKDVKERCDLIFVDFHAEATSEKQALAYYFDGQVNAVVGTHTHVQTADERILPRGTAYLSDAGMVGVENSVLGMDPQIALQRFLYGFGDKLEVPKKGKTILNAVLFSFDKQTKQCLKIERIQQKYEVK